MSQEFNIDQMEQEVEEMTALRYLTTPCLREPGEDLSAWSLTERSGRECR